MQNMDQNVKMEDQLNSMMNANPEPSAPEIYSPYEYPAPPGMTESAIKSNGTFKYQPTYKDIKSKKNNNMKEKKNDENEVVSSVVSQVSKNEKPMANLVRVPMEASISTSKPIYKLENQIYKWQHVVFVSMIGQVVAIDTSNFKKAENDTSFIWVSKLFSNIFNNEMITMNFEPLLENLYCAHGKKLFCLNPMNGNVKWMVKLFHHHHQYLLVLNEGIYAVGFGYFQLFNKTNGKLIKEIKINTTIFGKRQSSLNHRGKYIYVCNVAGIKKIERGTLRVIYDRKPGNYDITLPSLLILDDKHAILNSYGYINLIDLEKCITLRRTQIVKSGIFYFKKGIAMMQRNSKVVFLAHSDNVMAINPYTHQIYYTLKGFKSYFPITQSDDSSTPHGYEQDCLAQDSKHVYISGGAQVKAIDPANGQQIWSTKLPYCPRMFTMMRVNEEKKIIFIACRGFFFGISSENGSILFVNKMRGFGRGHPGICHLSSTECNVDFTAQPWLQSNWIERSGSNNSRGFFFLSSIFNKFSVSIN